jgi:hypothetical protein
VSCKYTQKNTTYERCEVLTAVNIMIMIFWDVTSHTNANILEKPAVSIFRIKEKYLLGLLDSMGFTSVDVA